MTATIQKSSAMATKIMRENKRKQRVTPITEDAPAGEDAATIDVTHADDPRGSVPQHPTAERPSSPTLPTLTPIGNVYPSLRGKKIVLEALPSSPIGMKARSIADGQSATPPQDAQDQSQPTRHTETTPDDSSSTTELLADLQSSSNTAATTPTSKLAARSRMYDAAGDTNTSPTAHASASRSILSPFQRRGNDTQQEATQQEATAASETEGELEQKQLSHMIAKIRDSAVAPPKPNVHLERQQLKGTRVLHPQEPFILTWQFIVGIGILYSIIVVPLRLGFDYDAAGTWYVLEFVIDGFFFVDIALNFRTAFFNEERLLISDPRAIFWRYAKGWFLVDLVSTVPIDELVRYALSLSLSYFCAAVAYPHVVMLPSGVAGGGAGGTAVHIFSTKLLRLLRVVRLLKLVRLIKPSRVFGRVRDTIQVSSAGLF